MKDEREGWVVMAGVIMKTESDRHEVLGLRLATCALFVGEVA